MDLKNTILSLKNSSPGYDEFPAFIAKQCIDNYVVQLTYVINMLLVEGMFPSELKLAKVVPSLNLGNLIKFLIIDQYQFYHSFLKYLKKIKIITM